MPHATSRVMRGIIEAGRDTSAPHALFRFGGAEVTCSTVLCGSGGSPLLDR